MDVSSDVEVKSQTPKQYARVLFEDSLVNGLPNIVKTPSMARKIFKVTVLVLCLGGFLYQATEFLTFVLTFPSVVDIEVVVPSETISPAVTFCNNNGIKRSKFCSKYPDHCQVPENMTSFCEKFAHYCYDMKDGGENFTVPKPEHYDFEKTAKPEEIYELGHDFKSLVKNIIIAEDFATNSTESNEVDGPLIFVKMDQSPFSCYTILSRAKSNRDPGFGQRNFEKPSFIPSLQITFDFEESETFIPGREPGGLLSIHSPYDFVNPHQDGESIKPGELYKVHYDLEEERLLPWPYQTNCMNYTLKWLENDRKGPRSQMMCKELCVIDFFVHVGNCSPGFPISYPAEQTKWCDMQNDFENVPVEAVNEYSRCISECKDDCQKFKFNYKVQEKLLERGSFQNDLKEENKRLTRLEFYALDPEVVVLKYRPQYQNIEIFSYIGGYIGAWLGISLVAVIDFLESMGLLAFFTFRKKSQRRDEDNINSVST